MFLLVRALAGAWQVRELKRRSFVADASWADRLAQLQRDMDTTQPIELRIAHDMVSPMTWGILRSVILLPSVALQWSEQRCRLVLAHELAHVVAGELRLRDAGKL